MVCIRPTEGEPKGSAKSTFSGLSLAIALARKADVRVGYATRTANRHRYSSRED